MEVKKASKRFSEQLGAWADGIIAAGPQTLSLAPTEVAPEVFLVWKGQAKEETKLWPSKLWWEFWNSTTCIERAMNDKTAWKECKNLFTCFVIGVLQTLGIETPGAKFFVRSSFGLGLYQLMPNDWEKLETAAEAFEDRLEQHWRALELPRIEKARSARGLPERKAPTDEDELCERLEEEEKHSKGWLCMYDAGLASSTMARLETMTRNEREALDIESDSDDDLEITADVEEKTPDVSAAVAAMRTEARRLLEEANKLAIAHNAASAQRKLERRFDNGFTWVGV
jgi:hypothetical protein